MQWFGATYTKRFNIRHYRSGHLFQGRFKNMLVQNGAYMLQLSYYIHRNPLRAGMKKRLSDYTWSSYSHYLRPSKRPEWLKVDKVFSCLRAMDDRKGRGWYRRYMQQRVAEIAGSRKPHDLDPDWSKIRRGWCLGEPSFREKLLEHLDHIRLGKKASSLSGTEIHCHNERQAKQLKAKALRAIGLTDSSLKDMPKGPLWMIVPKIEGSITVACRARVQGPSNSTPMAPTLACKDHLCVVLTNVAHTGHRW